MPRIILTAENFAFGPISKLLFIADLLRDKNHQLIFVGHGTSLQLAKKFPFNEIHEVDTDLESSTLILKKLITGSDLLISSMDLATVIIANELAVPVVWIDCLFWFWEAIPEPTYHVGAYIRELTISDNKNKILFEKKIDHLVTVGPIIGARKSKARKQQALISYGGGEAAHWYKVGKDTNYPFVMTSILNQYVDWRAFEKVIISSNENIIQQLIKLFPNSRFEFTCLSQENFLEELAASQVLLTTAGLVTTESAFQQETPVIFLPSSNNSHYLLLDELRKLNLAPASVQLSDFLGPIQIRGIPPHESMSAVMRQLKEFENSQMVKQKVGEMINDLVIHLHRWSGEQIMLGKKYIDSLGGNGAEQTLRIIENILRSRKSKSC